MPASSGKAHGGIIWDVPSTQLVDRVLHGTDTAASLAKLCTSGDAFALRTHLSTTNGAVIAKALPQRIYWVTREPTSNAKDSRRVASRATLNCEYLFGAAAMNGNGECCQVLADFTRQHKIEPLDVVTRDNVWAALEEGDPRSLAALYSLYHGIRNWDMGHGQTVLSTALVFSTVESFAWLVGHGANINGGIKQTGFPGTSGKGRSIVAFAASMCEGTSQEKSLVCLRELIRAGAEINGSGALQAAASAGSEEAREMLLEAGADIMGLCSIRDARSAHYAAGSNRGDMIAWLEEKGADLTLKDVKGRTPWQVLEKAAKVAVKQGTVQLNYESWLNLVLAKPWWMLA